MSAAPEPGTADTSGWNPNAQEAALLLQALEASLGSNELDASRLAGLLPVAMKTVQTYGLPGPRKKALVLGALNALAKCNVQDPEARDALVALVDTMGPVLIDQFVSVATGALDLGKRVGRRWCGC